MSHRKQKIKKNKTFSTWSTKGFILGPLLFNIFLCDLFLFISNIDFVSYADDNTPFAMGSSELEVINKIKSVAECLTSLFRKNCMNVNPDKVTAQTTIFSFSKCFEKMVFPKKSHWNMIFLVLSGKMILLFPENMILFFRHKRKDDLPQQNT